MKKWKDAAPLDLFATTHSTAELKIKFLPSKGKRLVIRLQKKNGAFHVRMPKQMPLQEAKAYVHLKKSWLHHTYAKWQKRAALNLELDQIPEKISIWGIEKEIIWHTNLEEQDPEIVATEDKLFCTYNPSVGHAPTLLDNYLREELWKHIRVWEKKWGAKIGIYPKVIQLKRVSSSWGSCHPKQRKIMINLKLIHYPKICAEYVWVHEMVHLLEASHNSRFHLLMQKYMPHYKNYRNLLRHYPFKRSSERG